MAASPIAALTEVVGGRVVERGDADYDEKRSLYNALVDKRPAGIVYCIDNSDVAAALRFARERGLAVSVRCGGHHVAGFASVEDGIVIDLSALDEVHVDPAGRTVRVGGGAKLSQVDEATCRYGLALPVGACGTTGVGGLTLGGGLGPLTRRLGLMIDTLQAATAVLADGSVVETAEEREPDLFWALRGGGGNFGVVTSFTFRAEELAGVQTGSILYALEDAAEVLRWYGEFAPTQPDALWGAFSFRTVPPLPSFPGELQLRKVCAISWCHAGEHDSPALREARAFGKPLLDTVMSLTLPEWKRRLRAFDALYPGGEQQYWRGEFVRQIPDEAIEHYLACAETMPAWKSALTLYPVDGAAARVSPEATAWAYRDAVWAQVISGTDPDPANAPTISRWVDGSGAALSPYALGPGYVNYNMHQPPDRVRAMYGANYERLSKIKTKYDPDNALRVNHNIQPA